MNNITAALQYRVMHYAFYLATNIFSLRDEPRVWNPCLGPRPILMQFACQKHFLLQSWMIWRKRRGEGGRERRQNGRGERRE